MNTPVNARPRLAITVGEPAGIGPEISLRAAWELRGEMECILVGDSAMLSMLASHIDPAIRLAALSWQAAQHAGLPDFGADRLAVIDCPLNAPVIPGQLDAANGLPVLRTLDIGIEGTLAGVFDAMVTAPLQKSTINDAGVAFTGHTEYLADKTGTPKVVMMLADGAGAHPLRVALATTHLPLAQVPAAITRDSLVQVLAIVHQDLREKFGIAHPRILATGLNPHAGENGYLGREEIEVITPALETARARGIDVQGPYPADTLFQEKYLAHADCVLAMYHDQCLPVLKHASFGRGVNITLGLPLVRTSVDHGTALDIAAKGLGIADIGSMREALRVAAAMARARRAGAA